MPANKLQELFDALTADMAPEDILSEGIKGLIAADITMQRQKKGISQAQLAEILGVKQAQVSKWESGDVNYTIETLCRIASALDMEIHSPFERTRAVSHVGESSYRSHLFPSPALSDYRSSFSSVPVSRTAIESRRLYDACVYKYFPLCPAI